MRKVIIFLPDSGINNPHALDPIYKYKSIESSQSSVPCVSNSDTLFETHGGI